MYSIPYIIFLSFLFLLLFLEIHISEKEKIIIRNINIICFILFFGLRGFIGGDYVYYYDFFEKLPIIHNLNLNEYFRNIIDFKNIRNIEIGFTFYTSLLKSIFYSNYHLFIFFNTVIDILLLNIFFKDKLKYRLIGFILFYIFGSLSLELEQLRNIKSFIIFLISIKNIYKKKFFTFLFLNIIGMSFHVSSIIYIPIYFFITSKNTRVILNIIFFISLIIYILDINLVYMTIMKITHFLGNRYEILFNSYTNSNNIFFGKRTFSIANILIIILFFIFKIKEKELLKSFKKIIFINSFYLYLIFYFLLGEMIVLSDRISNLFIFSFWILLGSIFLSFKKKLNNYLYLFFIIFISYIIVYRKTNNENMKYSNLIFGIDSYEDRKMIYENSLKIYKNE